MHFESQKQIDLVSILIREGCYVKSKEEIVEELLKGTKKKMEEFWRLVKFIKNVFEIRFWMNKMF
jgi:hypothetical protein